VIDRPGGRPIEAGEASGNDEHGAMEKDASPQADRDTAASEGISEDAPPR